MPVYNERAYLRRCVEKVLRAKLPEGFERELIIVDDASTDGSAELIEELAEAYPETIRAFFQEHNQGKGAAVRRTIEEMRGQYAIIQDADLEYEPEEYSVLLRPLIEGKADVVYGSRFASRTMRRVLNYHHSLVNKFLTTLSNVFTGLNLTDMETCYKVFRADVLQTIPIRSNRFGLEPEITAKVAKRSCVIYEVPISYYGRTFAEGKKINWKDGVSAVYTILKYWLIDDCYEERYGQKILESLSSARRFSAWMVSVIEPFLGRNILEVGSGIGNISRLLPKRSRLTVTDMDKQYLDILKGAYRDHDLVDVAKLDLTLEADFDALSNENYDSVVCMNVLEHIEDDATTLRYIKKLLRPGGRLVLLVPQYPKLYGSFDRDLDHFRRYDRKELKQLLTDCGYKPVAYRNFNALSIAGWWLNACVLQRKTMGKFQIKILDMLVPVLKPLEAIFPHPGLSIIYIAENIESSDQPVEQG